jgi:hypothetical protein
MTVIAVTGVDQVVVEDREGTCRFRPGLPQCTIAAEARSRAPRWARKFQGFGHEVQLIRAKFVRPFVKRTELRGTHSGGRRRTAESNDTIALCSRPRRSGYLARLPVGG